MSLIKIIKEEEEQNKLRLMDLEKKAKEEAEKRYIEEHYEKHVKHQEDMRKLELEEAKQRNEIEKINYEIEQIRLEVVRRVKENPNECAICYERPPECVVIPCGHAYFCYVCLLNQSTNYKNRGCPYCRCPIDKIQNLIN